MVLRGAKGVSMHICAAVRDASQHYDIHVIQFLKWLYTAPLSLGVLSVRKDSVCHIAQ